MSPKRLGFFTRVLDDAPPAARYRLALEQIVHAERLGLDAAWVAQHHFDGEEGGLPLPLVSHGGSAMLTIMIGFGILMSAYVHRDAEFAGRGDDG